MTGEFPAALAFFAYLFIAAIAFVTICFVIPVTIMRIYIKRKRTKEEMHNPDEIE